MIIERSYGLIALWPESMCHFLTSSLSIIMSDLTYMAKKLQDLRIAQTVFKGTAFSRACSPGWELS